MEYAKLENVFGNDPFTLNNTSPFNELRSAYPQALLQSEQQYQKENTEPILLKQKAVILNCDDYEKHSNHCSSCMYRHVKRRSNFLNIIILFALLWLIFKKK